MEKRERTQEEKGGKKPQAAEGGKRKAARERSEKP